MATMIYFLSGMAVLLVGMLLMSLVKRMTAQGALRALLAVLFASGLAGLIVLALARNFALAGAIGFVLLWLVRLWRVATPPETPAAPRGDMTQTEALRILGLEAGADRAAIEAAYRALMQKNHPDHGGTDGLATQLTEARDTLLRGDPS